MALYVKVFTSFFSSRKTIRLRAELGNDALWVPIRLWSYAAENQPDGDFSGYSPEELAMLIGYQGDALRMLEALQKACFLDGMTIHDWEEHNSYHKTFSERGRAGAAARWGDGKKKEAKKKDTKPSREDIESSIATSMLEASFPLLFEIEGFTQEFLNFKASRVALKKKMTPRAEELLLKRLSDRPKDALSALQMAIESGWQGFKWEWFDKNPPQQPKEPGKWTW